MSLSRAFLAPLYLGNSALSPNLRTLRQQFPLHSFYFLVPDLPHCLRLQAVGFGYSDAVKKTLRQSRKVCNPLSQTATVFNWSGAGGADNLQQLPLFRQTLTKWQSRLTLTGSLTSSAGSILREDVESSVVTFKPHLEVEALLQELAAMDTLYQLIGSTGLDVAATWPTHTATLYNNFWQGVYDQKRSNVQVHKVGVAVG